MDKSWIDIKNRADLTYIIGIDAFLEWAFTRPRVSSVIRCPCKGCRNTEFKVRNQIRLDLLKKGFWDSYKVWDLHGEASRRSESFVVVDNDLVEDDNPEEDDINQMLHDAYGMPNVEGLNNDSANNEEPNGSARKFYELLEDAGTQLYPGCDKVSKLSFIVRLLHLKCLNHWSNKSMDALLSFFKEVLPEGALIPNSYYEAKKVIKELGLDYTKIDACENDCILYWGEHENKQSCPKCNKPRWKLDKHKGKKVAHKVLRHFPIKPRLQRLYMAKHTAKGMRWHKEGRIDDGILRHPADSMAWKTFDEENCNFSNDPRSVRLGLASDGFQPYGNMSTSHSIWPVVLVPYNLPPWDCMKHPYFMMTLLIPGPKCPGDDIDVYLQPMIEELKELWEIGVDTYDAHTQSNFRMHAALLWTINDFPAYGNLSGWSTKGKLACPCCHKDTHSISLRNKLCYMGHRRFLPTNHPWRRNRRAFDGKVENNVAPTPLTGDETLTQLQKLGNVVFGKGQKRKRDHPNNAYNWRKKSIFFKLPYWKDLLIRHNLDVMHIERNVSDNILSTVMNVTGKTKDTVKSRYDLVDLGIRQRLHPIEDGNNILLPAACYTLSSEEKLKVCDLLANLKVPDAFSSNISRCVNVREKKLFGLKCHDHHVLIQDIFPIVIRDLLPKEVSEPIIELGRFFKNLCSKCLTMEALENLESQIILTLCKLEIVFPPAFFDVMVHLPIHLAREARLGGPVQYRWMYPIERYLRTLKSYVRNKARPEGSIAEGYIVEESLTFCSRYLKNIPTKFNIPPRNDDGPGTNFEIPVLKISGQPRGGYQSVTLSQLEFHQASMYVLQNCEEVWPFMEEHKKELELQGSMLDERHDKEFQSWFRSRVLKLCEQGLASDDLKSLAVGPFMMARRYSTFMVHGFRFHTEDRPSRRKTQNSGVLVKGDDSDPEKEYYGVLEDIYELSYIGNRKLYLFRCRWWDVARLGRGYKVDKYGLVSVNTRTRLNTNEPFVLASQAEQVFYVKDVCDQSWVHVVKTSPRDLFNVPQTVDEDIDDYHTLLVNEDAYQQEEVDQSNMFTNDVIDDIAVVVHRPDVEPQSIHTSSQPQRNISEDDSFINDAVINESSNEESDEEEFVDISEDSNKT